MVTPNDEWFLMLPEGLLALAALVIPFLSAPRSSPLRGRVATTALLASLFAILWMLYRGNHGFFDYFANLDTRPEGPVLLGAFEVTPFALFFKFLFVGIALLVVVASRDSLGEGKDAGEYYSLLLLSTLGMMVVASARDLITLFVGLETAALSSYTLVGYRRRTQQATESATKFFIIGALSAALTLYGISLVYLVAGTVEIEALSTALKADSPTRVPMLLASAFLIAGFGFKITSVPFHMWAPDVYQGAPDPISALLSAASKKMGFAAFFKVFLVALVAFRLDWGPLLAILAVLTMTLGNLAALQQTSMKRLLAWSSVGQAGYIMIALAVATPYALTGGLFHVLTHGLMKVGAFLLVAILAARGVGDSLDDYRGLLRRHPLSALLLTLLMLSLVGIPPLAGFWSKFILFGGAVQAGGWFIGLAVAGIANSAISVVYYARVIRNIYLDEPSAEAPPARLALTAPATAVVMVVLALTLLMSLWPGPWIDLSRGAAESLLGP